MRNKLLLVLALVAVFAAGFATRTIVSSLCAGGSCGRHADMGCCKKDGSCDHHGKHAGMLDSTNISLPGTEGEGKACCKKDSHAATETESGLCCKKTERGDAQACCGKRAQGDLQACCKKT